MGEGVDKKRARHYSASSADRHDKCPSSYARTLEVVDFMDENGISGNDSRADADRGRLMHDILADVPYASKNSGIGEPFRLFEKLKEVIADHGQYLYSSEFWWCYHAIQWRNKIIDYAISHTPGKVASVKVDLDAERLSTNLEVDVAGYLLTERISGLPDVRVQIRTDTGQDYGVILDYKSGMVGAESGRTNPQLSMLAALDHWNNPNLVQCMVAIIDRKTGRNSSPELAIYGEEELIAAQDKVKQGLSNALTGREIYLSSIGQSTILADRSAKLADRQLDDAAVVGDHCLFCKGKAACGLLEQEMQEFQSELKSNQPRMDEISETLSALAAREDLRTLEPSQDGSRHLMGGEEVVLIGNTPTKSSDRLVASQVFTRSAKNKPELYRISVKSVDDTLLWQVEIPDGSPDADGRLKLVTVDPMRVFSDKWVLKRGGDLTRACHLVAALDDEAVLNVRDSVEELEAIMSKGSIYKQFRTEVDAMLRQLAETKKLEGVEIGKGRELLKLANPNASPKQIFEQISPLLEESGSDVDFDDFIERTASVSTVMLRDYVAQENGIYEGAAQRLITQQPDSPVTMQPTKPVLRIQ